MLDVLIGVGVAQVRGDSEQAGRQPFIFINSFTGAIHGSQAGERVGATAMRGAPQPNLRLYKVFLASTAMYVADRQVQLRDWVALLCGAQ